jgi:hypothetical protein
LKNGAVALVDSPRWPCDLDYSASGVRKREQQIRGRKIDPVLRAIVSYLGTLGQFPNLRRLSMFPTPPLSYFIRCLGANCKPHLRAFGTELFGDALVDGSSPVVGGAIFTRFMLAGFATYRALERLGVETFESYPDLQFQLWAGADLLPSKRYGRAALRIRQKITRRLASELKIENADEPKTMDQADAAILALSADAARQTGALAILGDSGEGRFALALGGPAAEALGFKDCSSPMTALTCQQTRSPQRSPAAACNGVRK